MKKIIFMMLAVVALTSCSKFEQVPTDENGSPVELYGEIYTGAETRGDGVIDGIIPSGGLLFDLYRANQDATSAYSTYTLRINGTLGENNDNKITTTPKLYYLTNGKESSFIGLYPRGGTPNYTATPANTVTYPLADGGTDILATQSLEGNKTTQPAAAFSFQHLLTKIRVEVKVDWDGATETERDALITSLGNIKSLKVEGKSVNAVVTLPTPGIGARPTIATGTTIGDGDLALVNENGTSIDAAGIALTPDGLATTIGFAMFVPSEAAEQLTYKITTAYSSENEYVVVTPSAKENLFAQGYGYKITIRLDKSGFDVVEVAFDLDASVDTWKNGTTDTDIVYE
jgi:hypothetical protein